jgi:hypothetical protein
MDKLCYAHCLEDAVNVFGCSDRKQEQGHTKQQIGKKIKMMNND